MPPKRPHLVLAYHGCDKKVRDRVVRGHGKLDESHNEYDWLGHGIYFWENSYERALEFAQERCSNPRGTTKIETPAVLGAVVALEHCLDLLDSHYLKAVKSAHKGFISSLEGIAETPRNTGGSDRLLRYLDCAVIEYLHESLQEKGLSRYDTVRSVFFEGKTLYPGAGFRTKNHIQLCVANYECILGYFIPPEERRH